MITRMKKLFETGNHCEPLTNVVTISDHAVYSTAFSRNGKYWAIGSHNFVRIWDANTFQELLIIQRQYFSQVQRVIFSEDNKYFVIVWINGVSIYDAHTFDEFANQFSWNVTCPAFSSNGKYFAIGNSDDNTIEIYETSTFSHIFVTRIGCKLINLSFSQNSKSLDINSVEGVARLWDSPSYNKAIDFGRFWMAHSDYSRNGKYLAIIGKNKNNKITVKVHNASNLQKLTKLRLCGSCPLNVAFSNDSKYLAVSFTDKTVRIYETNTFKELTIILACDCMHGVTFSSNDKYLVTIGRTAMVWDTKNLHK